MSLPDLGVLPMRYHGVPVSTLAVTDRSVEHTASLDTEPSHPAPYIPLP